MKIVPYKKRLYYKAGDRAPAISLQVLKESDGVALDITGASVLFVMAIPNEDDKVSAAATITDAVAGTVQYAWGATDLDTAGVYRGEFRLTLSGGLQATFPPNGYFEIIVLEAA